VEHQVNAGERKRLRGAEAPVRSEAPEMEDLAYDRPQPRMMPRRTKPGEEVPRGGAYPPPVSAALDLTSLQLVSQQSGSVDVGKFSGNREEDWRDFLRKYERHARALSWRADKMKVELSLHLAGKALLDYELRFSEQAPETYAELIGYLGKKFTSQLDGITSIPAFTGRRMKPNESVNEYYADLVVKARCAFPGSSKDVLDSRIFETFVTNIGNEGLRVHLLSKDVKNIDQALNEALRFERIRGATLLEDRVNRVIGERENPQGTELHNWQGEPPQ